MKKSGQLSLGFQSYIDAFGFIFKHGLWMYFAYPVLIAILLFTAGMVLVGELGDYIEGLVVGHFRLDDPDSWLLATLGWVVGLFIRIILFIIFYYVKASFVKYTTLIVLSPVLARVSEKTEEIITGKKYPFDAAQFMRDVLRGILMALRNMLIEYSFIALFFFISFLPIIGWLASLVALSLVSWFFYGFSMIDYSNERKRMNISASTSFSWKYKWLCTGSGLCFWLIFSIPWIGVIVAPITGAVASTLAVNTVLNKEPDALPGRTA